MPKSDVENKGRGFDVYDAIGWEQRIKKEDDAIVRDIEMPRQRSERNRHHVSHHSRRSKSMPSQRTRSTATLLEDNPAVVNMPENLRALCDFDISNHCLITMRPKKGDSQPQMRLRPEVKTAKWVAGKGQLTEYKPVFYFEEPQNNACKTGPCLQGTTFEQKAPQMSESQPSKLPVRTVSFPDVMAKSITAFHQGGRPRTPNGVSNVAAAMQTRDLNQIKAPRFRRHQGKSQRLSPFVSIGKATVLGCQVSSRRH